MFGLVSIYYIAAKAKNITKKISLWDIFAKSPVIVREILNHRRVILGDQGELLFGRFDLLASLYESGVIINALEDGTFNDLVQL